MMITHLVCGVILGSGAALASLIIGLPVWAAILVYVLGGNIGMLASALAAYLCPPEKVASAVMPDVAHA